MKRARVRHKPRVVVFGTYDRRNPRTHVICNAMRALSWSVEHSQLPLTAGTAQKLDVFTGRRRLVTIARALTIYPRLVWRALNNVPFDYLMITMGGFVDILFGWIVARIAGAQIIFDPLYGLCETVVEDRRLIPSKHALSKLLKTFEKLCFRLGNVVLVDTREHREYFAHTVDLPVKRITVVPVGAREELFFPRAETSKDETRSKEVLFYGSMIPLHGADVIVRAAAHLRDAPIHFTIIGKGQTTQLVQHLAKQLDTRNVTFIDEVPFGTIPRHLAPADISLGIFGTTEKCRCVVPNKVYESIAMGKCVITGDTPAIREEFTPDEHLVVVACGDDKGLADSIRVLCSDDALRERISRQGRKRFVERLSTEKIAQRLKFLEDRLR